MNDIVVIQNDESDFVVSNEQVDKLLSLAVVGQVDGSHHKAWAIDQMVRVMLGEVYDEFVVWYEEDGEYVWDTGITP